jgi:23S rRNA (cytidine1920-2'-O)/16S rRNA (cytidine1409-2'-O)-methyltransferase
MRIRLDQFLVDEGYFESRARARAAVMEGMVSVDGRSDVKPGTQVGTPVRVEVREQASRYVSRGGLKLEGALEDFGIDVAGMSVLDVGASTGGFTDCLLQHGAARVIALDVGKGQLHWKLRQDERVTVLERFNVRELRPGDLPLEPDLATMDVSFISLEKVTEPVIGSLAPGGEVLALVKPQFEAGRGMAPRGVVRDAEVHLEVLRALKRWLESRSLTLEAVTPSRIRGPKGNIEFFIRVTRGRAASDEDLAKAVEKAHSQA